MIHPYEVEFLEDKIIHISLFRAVIDGVILNLNMLRLLTVHRRLSLEPWTYLVWPPDFGPESRFVLDSDVRLRKSEYSGDIRLRMNIWRVSK